MRPPSPSFVMISWMIGSITSWPIHSDAPITLTASARCRSNQRTASVCAGMYAMQPSDSELSTR